MITFKCAVESCYDSTYGDHAVCFRHFALDFALMAAIGFGAVGCLIKLARMIFP